MTNEEAISYLESIPKYIDYNNEAYYAVSWEILEAIESAIEALKAQRWIPCSEPPEDDRSVFIAYGNEKLKSCCIGFYEPSDKCWREQRNFFATLIYGAKYWCDMPELPEGWYEL